MHSILYVVVVMTWANISHQQSSGFDIITEPTMNQNVVAGSTLDIVWTPTKAYDNDTVTLTLLQGTGVTDISLGSVIAVGTSSHLGTYSWSIPEDLTSYAVFVLELSLDSQDSIIQCSFPFHITGLESGVGATSSAGSTTSTTTVSVDTASTSSAAPTPATTVSTPISSATSESPAPTSQISQSSSLASASSTSQPSQSASSSVSSTSQQTQALQTTSSTLPTSSTISTATLVPAGHSELSTGAKVGIGIGATIGALLLLGLIFGAFWFGTRHAVNQGSRKDRAVIPELGEGGVLGGEMNAEKEKSELAGTGDRVHEVEVGEKRERIELEGKGKGKGVFEIG